MSFCKINPVKKKFGCYFFTGLFVKTKACEMKPENTFMRCDGFCKLGCLFSVRKLLRNFEIYVGKRTAYVSGRKQRDKFIEAIK